MMGNMGTGQGSVGGRGDQRNERDAVRSPQAERLVGDGQRVEAVGGGERDRRAGELVPRGPERVGVGDQQRGQDGVNQGLRNTMIAGATLAAGTAVVLGENTQTRLGGALMGVGITVVTTAVIHDLYQRYQRYIKPADETAEYLRAGGVHGKTEDADLNVEQGLDTLRQVHDLRSARQDDTRANLSSLGTALSSGLRAGHKDIDIILTDVIKKEFHGKDAISEEEFEFAIQKAIMGSTRTRGSITGAARVVGRVADSIMRQPPHNDQQ